MNTMRVVVGVAVLAVGLGGLVLGQDPVKPKAKGQLPANWGKIGLTDDQKQRIYEVQTDYGTKISALQAQIAKLQKDRQAAMEKVLTDAQKSRLREIVTSKVPDDPPAKEKKKESKKSDSDKKE